MKKRGRRVNKTGRSAGASRHVRLHHWLLDCAAWRDLAPASRALLVELYALYNGTNNGQLFMSVREAAKRISVSRNTGGKALLELQGHGFIRALEKGAFSLKSRHATRWVLTEFEHAGKLGTKDFMRWLPAEIQNTVPKFDTDGANGWARRSLQQVA